MSSSSATFQMGSSELVSEKVTLTADQERGIKELLLWWNLPKDHPQYYNCIISAPAGTGKTFLVRHFTKQLQKAYPLFTATTNEAARQLELTGVKDVRTTHSALGLIPCTSQETAKFIQGSLPEVINHTNLLIIDECSMAGMAASEEADDLIIDYVLQLGIRTLWLGDWYQLPPVESNNGISPIFEQNFYTVNLTEVVRNKGAILEFCTALRGVIDSPIKRLPKVPYSKDIVSLTIPEFYKMILEEDFSDKLHKGTTRIIGWRNITVDTLNNKVREGIFGKVLANTETYLPTDQILFTKPLVIGKFPAETNKLVGNKELRIGASVNSRAEILKVTKQDLYKIPCYCCRIRIEGGIEETAYIPTKAGTAKLLQMKKSLVARVANVPRHQKASLWQQWHAFDSCFAKVKHSYAITTHRSQGSTIPNVVVDTIDILSGVSKSPLLAYKMLYTAVSRASNSLLLIRK